MTSNDHSGAGGSPLGCTATEMSAPDRATLPTILAFSSVKTCDSPRAMKSCGSLVNENVETANEAAGAAGDGAVGLAPHANVRRSDAADTHRVVRGNDGEAVSATGPPG